METDFKFGGKIKVMGVISCAKAYLRRNQTGKGI